MSDGEDIRSLVVDSATRIFRDFCDPQTINSARDLSWKEPLWRELTENGLALSWVPEENGGAGVGVGKGLGHRQHKNNSLLILKKPASNMSEFQLPGMNVPSPQHPIK